MNVFVTGSRGFIGRNLTAHLRARPDCVVIPFDTENCPSDLRAGLEAAEVIYHLAGVNRPESVEEFEIGNANLTREMCKILTDLGRAPVFVMSSSIQAALDSPYGLSKRNAEDALRDFGVRTGAPIRIYRLKNVFGKWCRPNYNSVVATFCHNIANDLPIRISDLKHEVDLVYIDDVIEAFLAELPGRAECGNQREIPSVKISLGELAGRIQSFQDMGSKLLAPDFGVRFNQQLYATYLSYAGDAARRQHLAVRSDPRGALAEFIKSANFGQIFVSRTRPGIIRGNHYHHTKAEKFFVVEGEALIRMRHIESREVAEYRVCGGNFEVIDIPPGFTHSVENVGPSDMVVIFWASEIFDPDRPDTYFLPVLEAAEEALPVIA